MERNSAPREFESALRSILDEGLILGFGVPKSTDPINEFGINSLCDRSEHRSSPEHMTSPQHCLKHIDSFVVVGLLIPSPG